MEIIGPFNCGKGTNLTPFLSSVMGSDWSSSAAAFTNAEIYFPTKELVFRWGLSNTKANKTRVEQSEQHDCDTEAWQVTYSSYSLFFLLFRCWFCLAKTLSPLRLIGCDALLACFAV